MATLDFSSSSIDQCSGHGDFNAETEECSCDDYYVGSDCSTNLYTIVGDKMWGVETFWGCMSGLLVLYGSFLLLKWKRYRPYTRAAIMLVVLSAMSDIGFRAIIIRDEIAEKGCSEYFCNLQDAFYALANSFSSCAFIVLIRSWLTVAALASANACMARFGVKIITFICVGLSFLGSLLLFIPLGANPRVIMSAYYLLFSAFVAVGFITSGVQVFRIIRKSRDNSAIRFTGILWLESITIVCGVLNALLLVVGDYTHKPSLLFYGAGILSNLYRWIALVWLLVLVAPSKSEEQSLSSSYSGGSEERADKTRQRFEGADSDSLFGSLGSELSSTTNSPPISSTSDDSSSPPPSPKSKRSLSRALSGLSLKRTESSNNPHNSHSSHGSHGSHLQTNPDNTLEKQPSARQLAKLNSQSNQGKHKSEKAKEKVQVPEQKPSNTDETEPDRSRPKKDHSKQKVKSKHKAKKSEDAP